MGLALDEPKEGDERYELDSLAVIMDPFAAKIVKDSGGLSIKNGIFGPMAELSGATSCGA
jgi:hypothetical protein